MSDTQAPPAQRFALRPETQDALRAMFRAAGGVTYGSPKGEMASILELKLFQLLAGLVYQADATGAHRAALFGAHGVGDRAQDADADRSDAASSLAHRTALARLVAAVCPGLDSGDLLADAETATLAMATADPIAYFGIDDEPATDGTARYMHVGSEHKNDEDVFPLYRRAPTLAELGAHIAQHQLGADVKGGPVAGDATAAGKGNAEAGAATKATKSTAAGKAASK